MSWKPEVIPTRRASGAATPCGSPRTREAEANPPRLNDEVVCRPRHRVVESDDAVSYRYVDGRLESLVPETDTCN
jgi:hypothetical protein